MMAVHQNLSVLTIDDDEDMRRSIVSYFEDMGFNVHQASGGCEGIKMFEQHHPDLVFTDLMMPGVDGLAVVHEITKLSPETPVVVISGNGSVEYAIKTVRNGAWDYITKPIHDFSIIDRITEQVLDRAYALKSEKAYKESLQRAVLSQDHQISQIGWADPLTKLPVRNQVRELFGQMMINQDFSGHLFVMLFELSNLKSVTETFGHECGDQLIKDLSLRLNSLVHSNVVAGRLGTDEFVVMVANAEEVSTHIAAVRSLFDAPYSVMEKDIYVNYNMGIATFPQDGETIDSLLQHADIAKANAKIAGLNHHCYYSRELWEHIQNRIELESALRKGLEQNEFLIHYQPKVDAQTKCMVGMEALIRWKPTGSDRLVSPVVFIPVLEETGLITEVGAWVLETACRQQVEWRQQGMQATRLSVNISAVQFNSGNLPEFVKGVLERTGIEPELLCLELTESIVVKDIEGTIEMLKSLSALGVKLSIDDFGTGYSSLSYLKDMPIDEMKIDRAFVMNLPGDPASVAIVESVLAMSKGMNLTVVAEGVETAEQAEFLASRGCHELQGYLFSKPLAKEELFDWNCHRECHTEHRAIEAIINPNDPKNFEAIAGGIAHDFRNILSGIVGNLSIAQIHIDESHQASNSIKRAQKASQRANVLAQKLMNLGQNDVLKFKSVDVYEAVSECVELTVVNKDIVCTIDINVEIPDVAVDEGDFCRIINNLLLNAVQAMPDGGSLLIHAEEIGITSDNILNLAEGGYVRIDISDTGYGIPRHIQNKIFEPRFTTKETGNGLGLASVKAIIGNYGGVIDIVSVEKTGTSVILYLPMIS